MLAHGSHLVDTARFLAGDLVEVSARLTQKFGAYCWFVDVAFANGAVGHLDLTVAVRMDWHEGLQLYGENGSVIAKTFNPWYYKASEVEIFTEKDATWRRPLGADGHFYRRQLEGFADTILHGAPMRGADIADGVASVRAMAAIARVGSQRPPGPARRRARAGLMQIGIFAKTFAAIGALPSLQAVRAAGYDVAHFNMAVMGGPSMPDTIDRATSAEIASASRAAGVAIVGLSGTYNMIHPDPAERAEGFARLAVLMRAAPLMGTRLGHAVHRHPASRPTSGRIIPTMQAPGPGAI